MAYIVDLRSDTVTKPTEAMKHAMVNSALGDDVFGEDPTVNALETKLAALLGKQAALFVPSGTMANLIAIMVHCNKRGSEAFVGNKAHIYKYEQGGASHLAGVLLSTLENKPDGTFDLDELESRIRGSDVHEPVTSIVAVENTHNVCGGKVLPLKFLDDLSALCKKHSLPIHMDGARLFNASVASNETPARIVRDCDSVSVCFSKGLSAPVGSALVGSCHFIGQARRVRKMLGGGMRQAGILAAAAIVALDEVVPILYLDHKRAQILAKVIEGLFLKTFTVDPESVHTNIVLVKIAEQSTVTAEQLMQRLAQVSLAETQGLFLKTFTVDPESVHTNIVLVKIAEQSTVTAEQLMQRLAQVSLAETQGDCKTPNDEGVIVKAVCFNKKTVRLTIHREINDEDLWLAIMKITYVFKELDANS